MSDAWLNPGVLGVLALSLSVLIDRLLGEPPNPVHPVVWIGSTISALSPDRRFPAWLELSFGALLGLGLPLAFALLTAKALALLAPYRGLAFLVHVYLLSSVFSLDGLRRAGLRMQRALQKSTDEGRATLSWLCSRDPSRLGQAELIAATVESVSENASDSFVAPVLFYALFGLPGAVFYRVVNTLDAMIGYRGRFEYFGKTAARLDDLCNWIPARVTALLLLAAGVMCGADGRGGLRVLSRDRSRTESPNAGWPMATMAGLLGVSLEKRGHYSLGEGPAPVDALLIERATRIVSLAGYLLLPIALPLIRVLHG